MDWGSMPSPWTSGQERMTMDYGAWPQVGQWEGTKDDGLDSTTSRWTKGVGERTDGAHARVGGA